ncbi:MAG: hypothetical protein JWR04_1664 [Rhodoglobus sp.]|nr:hypothetical protein [Rhodoglobus sp.]
MVEPLEVAAIFAMSEHLVGASWWSSHDLGMRLSAEWNRAIGRAVTVERQHVADEERTETALEAAAVYLRAHGLRPEFLLDMDIAREWKYGLVRHIESETGYRLAEVQLEAARHEMVKAILELYVLDARLTSPVARWAERQTSDRLTTLLQGLTRVDQLSRAMREDLATGAWNEDDPRLRHRSIPRRAAKTIGRIDELDALRTLLRLHRTQGLVAAVAGPSGAGKTHIVRDLVERCADDYDVVWWLPQKTADGYSFELLRLAESLGIEESASTILMTLSRVKNHLDRLRYRYLIVVDDAYDESVAHLLGDNAWGHVLVTTQRLDFRADVSFPLSGISIDELAGHPEFNDTQRERLAVRRQPDDTILPIELIPLMAARPTHLEAFVGRGDVLSGLRRADADAAFLACTLSLLATEQVSLMTFLSTRAFRKRFGLGSFEVRRRARELSAILHAFGLSRSVESATVSMHDTTRLRIQERMDDATVSAATGLLLESLVEVLPSSDWFGTSDERIAAFALHAERVFELSRESAPSNNSLRAALGLRLGAHLNAKADRTSALVVLAETGRLLDSSGVEGILCQLEIARATRHVGRLKDAFDQYVSLSTRIDWAHDPVNTLKFIAGFGKVLLDRGDHGLARTLCGALVRRLGDDHPSALPVVSILGRAQAPRRPREAHTTFANALDVAVRELGADNQATGWALDDLGAITVMLKKAPQGESLLTQALAIETASSGTLHPRRAWTLMNLAVASRGTNPRFSSECAEEAIQLQRSAVPTSNPDFIRFVAANTLLDGSSPLPLQGLKGSMSSRANSTATRFAAARTVRQVSREIGVR